MQIRPRRYCLCVSNLHSSIAIAILSTLLRISAMVLVGIFFQTQSNSSKVKIFFIVVMTLMCIYILVDFLLLWGIYKRVKGLLYLWIVMAIFWLALMVLKIFLDFVPPGRQTSLKPDSSWDREKIAFVSCLNYVWITFELRLNQVWITITFEVRISTFQGSLHLTHPTCIF